MRSRGAVGVGTFYEHTRGLARVDVEHEVEGYFRFWGLRQVLEGCGIEPDWGALGVITDDSCELCGGPMSSVLLGRLCGTSRYVRPRI